MVILPHGCARLGAVTLRCVTLRVTVPTFCYSWICVWLRFTFAVRVGLNVGYICVDCCLRYSVVYVLLFTFGIYALRLFSCCTLLLHAVTRYVCCYVGYLRCVDLLLRLLRLLNLVSWLILRVLFGYVAHFIYTPLVCTLLRYRLRYAHTRGLIAFVIVVTVGWLRCYVVTQLLILILVTDGYIVYVYVYVFGLHADYAFTILTHVGLRSGPLHIPVC